MREFCGPNRCENFLHMLWQGKENEISKVPLLLMQHNVDLW